MSKITKLTSGIGSNLVLTGIMLFGFSISEVVANACSTPGAAPETSQSSTACVINMSGSRGEPIWGCAPSDDPDETIEATINAEGAKVKNLVFVPESYPTDSIFIPMEELLAEPKEAEIMEVRELNQSLWACARSKDCLKGRELIPYIRSVSELNDPSEARIFATILLSDFVEHPEAKGEAVGLSKEAIDKLNKGLPSIQELSNVVQLGEEEFLIFYQKGLSQKNSIYHFEVYELEMGEFLCQ